MKKAIIASFATAIGLLFTIQTATAGDAKLYSPSGCSYDTSAFLISSNGTLENNSNSQQTVICPITRDYTLSHNDILGGGKTWISVKDQYDPLNVVCWLMRSYPSGPYYHYRWSAIGTSGTSSYWQKKSFDSITDNNAGANYFLKCVVPPINNGKRSGIGSYRIEEG